MQLTEKFNLSTLYVHRPLVNADQLIDWASQQGFRSTLPPDDMHVTLAFSKTPVTWHLLKPILEHLHVIDDHPHRKLNPLGSKGAVVLHFDHPHLHERWQHFLDHGASWEHSGFQPHVTITYDGAGLPLHQMMPYTGPLIFGPEEFGPLDENWNQKIVEVPFVVENRGISTEKTAGLVKYGESLMETNRMTELSNLLIKNIDLILEAYNIDDKGNLVIANKRKVNEADEVFHEYFVKSMNQMFRRINENDPIMQQPDSMGLPQHGHDDLGIGSDMMGDMSPMGPTHHPMDGEPGMDMGDEMGGLGGEMLGGDDFEMEGGGMNGGGMSRHPAAPHGPSSNRVMAGAANPGSMANIGAGMGGMGGGMAGGAMESAEAGEYDWLFNEDVADLDIDQMFDITEDEQPLNEFGMGMHDDMEQEDDGMGMGDGMDMAGGHNDFGGDMGGMGGGGMMGGDDMGMGGGMDHMGGGMGGMGGDEDMVTIHGETDNGSPFEFSFDPSTIDMGMGGDDEFGGGDEFGGEHHHHEPEHHEGGESDFGGGEDEEEDNEPPVSEAAFHNGKPRKTKGAKSARMAVVPANPATSHAAPFPTPQGSKQKR